MLVVSVELNVTLERGVVMKNSNVSLESSVFRRVIAERPWLFIVARYIYSYPGLTLEELKEISGLKAEVVKRGVWWLKKYGVVEERNGKLFIPRSFAKIIESLIFNTCSTVDMHILLVDMVYIVFRIRGGKIEYWSLPAEYYEKISHYRDIAEFCSPERVTSVLDVNLSTAKKICLLLSLLRKCRSAGGAVS